ncbi:MAG: DUF1249 family protein [Vibrio sp.]
MKHTQNHKSYHVDLAALMRVYETNYAKLNALLSHQPFVGEIHKYQVNEIGYEIEVLEVTRYTTLVKVIEQENQASFPLPSMKVRLYHDARVAEVCASQQISYIKPTYNYPNPKMVQKDEKHQLNRFLGDWLTFCLRHGMTQTSLF